MSKIVELLLGAALIFTFIVSWLLGIVLAKGMAPTIFSILLPFHSWYLVVEWLFNKYLS